MNRKESEHMSTIRRCFCCLAVCLLSFFVFPCCTAFAVTYEKEHLEIPVMCLDVEDIEDHVYIVKITTEDTLAPLPQTDTLYINQNGRGQFEIDIDQPGTFVYNIFETEGDEDDIEYEQTVYTVTVYVETNANDELLYSVSAAVNGMTVKSEEIQFQDKLMDNSERKKPSTTTTTAPETTTTAAETTNTTATTTTTTAVTTAASVTATETASTTKANSIVSFVDDVLTGDSFPAKLLCIIIIAALIIMVGAFVLRKNNGDND